MMVLNDLLLIDSFTLKKIFSVVLVFIIGGLLITAILMFIISIKRSHEYTHESLPDLEDDLVNNEDEEEDEDDYIYNPGASAFSIGDDEGVVGDSYSDEMLKEAKDNQIIPGSNDEKPKKTLRFFKK